jgi:hypothetical protein
MRALVEEVAVKEERVPGVQRHAHHLEASVE